MLKKSKTSAVILALVTVAALLIVPYTFSEIVHVRTDPNDTNNFISKSPFALLVYLGGCLLVAAFIYRFDDSHFGIGGLIRWIVFGLFSGTLWQASSWLLATDTLAFEGLGAISKALFALLSYKLVFEWLWPPAAKGEEAEKTSNS